MALAGSVLAPVRFANRGSRAANSVMRRSPRAARGAVPADATGGLPCRVMRWRDRPQEGARLSERSETRWRSVRWSGADQSRTDDGTALGCVVPRRPSSVGHRPAAAGDRAAGSRRRIHRCGARCGLRHRRERFFTSPRWGCPFWASTWPRQRWASPGRRPRSEGSRSSSPWLTPGWASGAPVRHGAGLRVVPRFNAAERPGYVASLASVTVHGGTLYVLCFSDEGPDTGPHPVGQDELRAAFAQQMDGAPPPSNRTGCRRDFTATTAHPPGLRRSDGSSPDGGACRYRACGASPGWSTQRAARAATTGANRSASRTTMWEIPSASVKGLQLVDYLLDGTEQQERCRLDHPAADAETRALPGRRPLGSDADVGRLYEDRALDQTVTIAGSVGQPTRSLGHRVDAEAAQVVAFRRRRGSIP